MAGLTGAMRLSLKVRCWRVIDKALHKVGLMRCSQEYVRDLEFMCGEGAPSIIKITLRTGFRISGYLTPETTLLKPMLVSPNPIFEQTQQPSPVPPLYIADKAARESSDQQ